MIEIPMMVDVIVDGESERREATWQDFSRENLQRISDVMRVPRPLLRFGEIEVRLITGDIHLFRTYD